MTISDMAIPEFTIEELRALARILEHHYIDYHDTEAHDVVNKIIDTVRKYDRKNHDRQLAR